MAGIFLTPRSNETSYKNFLSTIESGLDYSIVEPYLNEENKKILIGQDKLFAWGNKESKKPSWDKMEKGDLILFYKGKEGSEKEGKFVYAGKLLAKQQSEELGLSLWPPKKGEAPWPCVFFLTDLKPVYVPISDITALSPKYNFSIVQGFMPVNDEAVKNFMEKFGSIDNFISQYSKNRTEPISDLEKANEVTAHGEAQLLLLKIGKILGYDTYTPDKNREAFGEILSDHATLDKVPARYIGAEMMPLVSQIDVIWFKEDMPQVAFEIEHSTKFASGFTRLEQLRPLNTKLFFISSRKNYHLFEKFITAEKHKKAFRFKDYTELENYFNSASKFFTANDTFLR